MGTAGAPREVERRAGAKRRVAIREALAKNCQHLLYRVIDSRGGQLTVLERLSVVTVAP